MSAGSTLSLLIWIERGRATFQDAQRSGRTAWDAWTTSRASEHFTIEEGGALALTDAGRAELADQRMGA